MCRRLYNIRRNFQYVLVDWYAQVGKRQIAEDLNNELYTLSWSSQFTASMALFKALKYEWNLLWLVLLPRHLLHENCNINCFHWRYIDSQCSFYLQWLSITTSTTHYISWIFDFSPQIVIIIIWSSLRFYYEIEIGTV